MAKPASEPRTELMRHVAAALNAGRPSELERLLVEHGVLHWQQARNVGRWWNGSVQPNSETTILLLRHAGLLRWPGETGAAGSPRKELEAARDLLPAKPRSSRATRRAAGQ